MSLVKIPPLSIVEGVSFDIINNLTLTNTMNFISDNNTTALLGDEEVFDGQRTLVDVDLRYNNKNYELDFGVKNLLDERYFVLLTGCISAVGMERSYYMDFKYKF